MKKLILILILSALSNYGFSQGKDFTFCWGNISVTIFDGGKAQMEMYNLNKKVINKKTGEFTLYGVGSTTELLKIQFNSSSEEYSYDLIRNGQGTPSVIIDKQARRYTLCKISNSNELANFDPEKAHKELENISKKQAALIAYDKQRNANKKYAPLSPFIGRWTTEDKKYFPDFIIDVESIPFQEMQNAKMNFQPNEKKALLKLTIVEGNERFEGISIERTTELINMDGAKYEIFFVDKEQKKMLGLEFANFPTASDSRVEFNKYTFKEGEWKQVRFDGQSSIASFMMERLKGYVPQKKLEVPKVIPPTNLAQTIQIKDINAKDYSKIEVKIGSQTWMSENLDVVTFRNGDSIPEAKNKQDWDYALKTYSPVYIKSNLNGGGNFYNIYAIDDKRGLAPLGWHIPSIEEWEKLSKEIKNSATEVSSKEYWTEAFGTNSTGFNGIPTGKYRNAVFLGEGKLAPWWSTSSNPSTSLIFNIIKYTQENIYKAETGRGFGTDGFPVRCIKD